MNESELLGRLCKMGVKINAVINLHNRYSEEDCRQMPFFNKMMSLFADEILYFSNRDFFTQGNLNAPVSLEPVAIPDFVKLSQKHSNALDDTITGWCIKEINTPPTSLKFPHVELVLHRDSIWGKVNQFDMTFMKRPTNPPDSGEGYNDRGNAIKHYLRGFGVSERKIKYFDKKQEYQQSILPLLEAAVANKLESVACIPFSDGGYEIIHEQLKNWRGEFPKEIHVFHLHKDDFDYFYKLPEAVITAPRMSKYEMLQFIEKSETQGKSKIEAVNELIDSIDNNGYQFKKNELLDILKNQYNGEFYRYKTPNDLANLISSIGSAYRPKNVIDICCGTGNTLSYFNNINHAKGIDINKNILKIARLINPNVDIEISNVLDYNFENEKYDLVICHAPLRSIDDRNRNTEIEFVQKGLEILSDDGVLISVVPHIFLNGNNSEISLFRQYLFQNFSIDMIIRLDTRNYLRASDLPLNRLPPNERIEPSLLIIRNGIKKESIFMPTFEEEENIPTIIDAFNNHTGDFYLQLSNIDESFRFDKEYYLNKSAVQKILEGRKLIKLSDIADVIIGEVIDVNNPITSDGTYSIFERLDKKINRISNNKSILKKGDIVISLRVPSTNKQKIDFYDDDDNKHTVVSKINHAIIRAADSKSKNYLSAYLQTEDWQTLVKTCFVGSVMQQISVSKLKELQIPLLSELELDEKLFESAKTNGNDDYFVEQIQKHLQARDYEKAKELNEEIRDVKLKSENLKNIEAAETIELKELEIKNKDLEQQIQLERSLHEKEKEMLSFFTHTMRNALATAPESLREVIRLLGSDDYEKNTKHYKAINKIVTLFSTLSLTDCLIDTFKQSISDQNEFKQSWQKDCDGDATPKWVIASALRQSLNRIIFMSDTDKLKMLLNNEETGVVKSTRKSFIDNVLPLDIDAQGITAFYDWVGCINLIEIVIDENSTPHFGTNQVKFSLLFSITSELILNAFKYWSGVGRIQISWKLDEDHYIFTVKNPCEANASSNLAGTHKGVAFIKRLMELLGEQAKFYCGQEEQSFVAELKLHKTLLEG
jgi:SAM-dependent methyltransferase